MDNNTIAAISTANAPGGIGIVRISGERAFEIAGKLFRPKGKKKLDSVPGHTAVYGTVYSHEGEKIDDALALVFRAPKSYTGEDVVELSCHGGRYVLSHLMHEIVDNGARPALAGEFTKRAFLNGKLELSEAESVMSLISAGSEQGARAAANGGNLTKRIELLKKKLKAVLAYLAAWADFPDEVEGLENDELNAMLKSVRRELRKILSGFETGKALCDGVTTVIVGKPNSGKSTLMNLLSGFNRSIVTDIEGTTRDVIEETVILGGFPLRIADTAGIRKTEDRIEKMGVRAALQRVEGAELILFVADSSRPLDDDDVAILTYVKGKHMIGILNKCDLPNAVNEDILKKQCGGKLVHMNCKAGEGLEELSEKISELFGYSDYDPAAGNIFTERQRSETERAIAALEEAIAALKAGETLDAVTVCTQDAFSALCSLTGENVSDAVIDEIFSKFCVGK